MHAKVCAWLVTNQPSNPSPPGPKTELGSLSTRTRYRWDGESSSMISTRVRAVDLGICGQGAKANFRRLVLGRIEPDFSERILVS